MIRKTVKVPPIMPTVADLSSAKVIWTAGGIARRLGCSADFVTSVLMKAPGCPIQRVGGRIYAVEPDLIAWMRDPSPKEPSKTA